MSEPHAAAHVDAHGEHLEVWPDAGITETAKKVPLWLVVLYIGFGVGLMMAYLNQFIFYVEGMPKYGPNYVSLDANTQYPEKINPRIETGAQVSWTVGQQQEFVLKATGGRVGRVWTVEPGESEETNLPAGITLDEKNKLGFALSGAPTTPGIYAVKLVCTSGSGRAEQMLEITVVEAGGGQ